MKPPYPIPPFRVSFEVRHIQTGEITRVEDDVVALRGNNFITAGNIPGVGPLDPEFCDLVWGEEASPEMPPTASQTLEL